MNVPGKTDGDWLAHMQEAGPNGWEFFPPSTPGAPWAAVPTDGVIHEWTPAELLTEVRHRDAVMRREIKDQRGSGEGHGCSL